MNWKKWSAVILLLAVLGFIGYSVWGSSQSEELPTVRTAEVAEDSITEVVVASGVIVPSQTQEIMGQGLVSGIDASVGDTVEEGDPLITYADGTSYTADFTGTVTEVNVSEEEPDNTAQMGQSSLVLADLNDLQVEVQLSRSDADLVEVDQPVLLTYGDDEYEGTVSQIDPIATQQQSQTGSSASLRSVITFDTDPEELIAGFEIDADITVASADQTLIVPIEALNYEDDTQAYVYSIKDSTAQRVDVETGIQSNTIIEVTGGLSAGDQVILSPSEEISQDTEVVIEE